MAGHVIGVDVGTTSTKAVLLGPELRLVAESDPIEHATRYPPAIPGAAEQDPEDWWEGSAACIREVQARADVDPAEVAAIAVSSMAPSVVPVDEDGRPSHPALLWLDRRGQAQCDARREADAQVRALSGNRLDPYYAAAKLAWLTEHRPDVAERTRTVLMANGYVNLRLTGRRSIDAGHATLTQLAGARDVRWQEDLLELWGVPARWLPEIGRPEQIVGEVGRDAAAACGLRPGTPVAHGLVDGAAAGLASGLAGHGDVCEMTGQSTVLNAVVERGAIGTGADPLSVMDYPIPGHVLVFGAMVSTGGILRWFRDELGGDGFAELDRLAAEAAPGSGGLVLLPYFLGERSPIWSSDARGALVGLSMGTRRADVVRAILEGTAYGLRHNVEALAALGVRPSGLRSVGGGARGSTWRRIKADVTGLALEVPAEAVGAPVGAALVAARAAGIVDDLADAVRDRYIAGERVGPDAARHAAYDRYFALYADLYPALEQTFAGLARLREAEAAAA